MKYYLFFYQIVKERKERHDKQLESFFSKVVSSSCPAVSSDTPDASQPLSSSRVELQPGPSTKDEPQLGSS